MDGFADGERCRERSSGEKDVGVQEVERSE
jgi:hypothetical protein